MVARGQDSAHQLGNMYEVLREAPGHYPAEFLGALSRSRVDHAGDHLASDSGIEGGAAARRAASGDPAGMGELGRKNTLF